MEKLEQFNNYIYDKYNLLENKESLSSPLLVSSRDDYLNNLDNKIMYIGQETNCWVNNSISDAITTKRLENAYYNFLKEGARNRDFWKFIKNILEVKDEKLINNVIWSNIFLSGKRYGMGHPDESVDLNNLSLEYLLFLYNELNPDYTIFVSGPKNPYYQNTIHFLKNIKSNITDTYPSVRNPLLVDMNKRVIWTYHPAFQRRCHIQDEMVDKVKKIIQK